jgi:hypothetical protein
MKRWKIASLILLGTVLLLAGFAAFVLPGIVKSQAVHRVEAATGRKLAIGAISINPFTLTLRVRDVRLSERAGAESFAAFSSARIALSPVALYRRAPVIAAARITSPRLRIVRLGANLYNFSDLLKFLPLHPRLSVNTLTVKNGSLDFIDRGLPVEKRQELRKVELSVPFITTMPYFAERYVTPRLSGVLNGSPFHLEGRLRPFPRAAEASATLEFKELSLPYYLGYLPAPLPVRVESGSISAKLSLSYRAAQQENPGLSLSGSLALADLKLSDRTGAPFLALKRLESEIARARFPAGDFDLSSLSADGLEVFLTRDRKGVWSHSRLAAAATPGAAARRKVLASVKKTRFRNGRLHFSDALAPGGFRTDLSGISLDMRDYSTAPGKRASYALSFATSRGERANLVGEFSPNPWAISSKLQLDQVPLEAYYPYLAWAGRSEVKGRFAFAGNLDFDRPQGLRLDQVSARAHPFATLVGGKLRITRASLSLTGGSYNRKENSVQVADVRLGDGDFYFSRGPEGGLRPLAARQQSSRKKAIRKPLRCRIGHILGTGMNAVFTDEKLPARPSFAFTKIDFTLERLAGLPFGPIPFKLAGAYGKRGRLSASGDLTPAPYKLRSELTAQRIPVADLEPYLPEKLNVTVADGLVNARLALSLESQRRRLTGSFGGSAGIHSLHCLDAEGEDLLKWDSLQLDGMQGSLAPLALDVEAVALTRFYSRIVVAKDGSLNLQHLYTRVPKGKEPQAGASAGEVHPVRIGALTMQDGTLAFADHHVQGGYAATLFNLGGRVTGLSSEENRFADLDLRGNLENRSPLRITGQINPLRSDLYADLKVSFTDIELPPMTPYSGTYLGYAVERGKLYLDSNYRIVNRKLDSRNRVFIDQLDLGKSIPSDRATNLPVRLAVALLKDRKGEIHLDLPVQGQTDDPQFSVWGVALKMLKNLVVKAASSPFALFQSLFGVKEDLSSVGFAAGSAALSRGEKDKLLKLAAALNDRPRLQLKVAGFVDRGADAEGYRNELLEKKMRAEKYLARVREKKNKPGDSPETVQITPEEYARILKAVYAREDFPKPRNILGQVKELPETELKKLILANTAVGERQMRDLADARAAGVRTFLVGKGGLASARVSQKSGDIFRAAPKQGEPGSRVEFEIGVE